MSAPGHYAHAPGITHQRAILGREAIEARYRIDGARASIAVAIKEVWRSYAAGEIDEAEAEHRDRQLRGEYPQPPLSLRACPTIPLPRPRRRPDLDERRQHARKLAFSGPMPPQLACMFTVAQLAVLNIVAGEVVEKKAPAA